MKKEPKLKILRGNDYFLNFSPYKIKDSDHPQPFDFDDYVAARITANNISLDFEAIKDSPLIFKIDLKNITHKNGTYDLEVTLYDYEQRKVTYRVEDLIQVQEFGKTNYQNFGIFYGDEKNFIMGEFKLQRPF